MSESCSSKTIQLVSSDGVRLEMSEFAGMKMSEAINCIYGCETWGSMPISFSRSTGNILSMVIKFCEKHAHENLTAQELKAFDSEFLNVDRSTLFELIVAANYMRIRSLLDVTCQAVVDMIDGLTPDEMLKTLGIENDFTPQEVEDLYETTPWALERKMDENSFCRKVLPFVQPSEFQNLSPEEKRKWVLIAVLVPHVRERIARYSSHPDYIRLAAAQDDDEDEESEMAILAEKSVGKGVSNIIEFDLTDFFLSLDEYK